MNIMMKDVVMAQERYADMQREAAWRGQVARLLGDAKGAAQPQRKRNWTFWRWVRRDVQAAGANA